MGKKPVANDTRVAIAALNRSHNFTQVEIAAQCGVSRKCVQTTIANLENTGRPFEIKRRGPKEISTIEEDQELFTLARANPMRSAKWLSSEWKREGARIASRATVNRRLKRFKLNSYVAAKKPLLTDVHKARRLAWCKDREFWTYRDWARVIFSDEANYKLINRKTTPRVRRYSHEKYDERYVKKRTQGGKGSIGVWGCIGQQGTGCSATFTGRLNSKGYLKILDDDLIPSLDLLKPPQGDFLFQQDGASCHTAKCVKRWFRQKHIKTLSWPANSPDLNPIEHVWAEIDKKLYENPPQTLADLEDAVTKLWNELSPQYCVSLIETMIERVKLCIEAKGAYFKY